MPTATQNNYSFKRQLTLSVLIVLILSLILVVGVFLIARFEIVVLKDRTILNGLTPPTMHARVIELYHDSQLPDVSGAGSSVRDFDGDGVEDVVSKKYFEMRPIFGRRTMGLFYIHSGASGELLLSHGISSMASQVDWVDDWDKNGTSNVLIADDDSWTVLGRATE